MKKYLIQTVFTLLLICAGCTTVPASEEKISVTASFYPMEFLLDQIAGDQVKLYTLVPSGFEPHDYELTPQDVGLIADSKLLVANGLVEPWFDNVESNLEDSEVKILNLSTVLPLLETGGGDDSAKDPHFWLDPVLMSQMADAVEKKLIEVDPAHATVYEANTLTLKEKLSQLDEDYKNGLSNCLQKSFVTSHAAFAYLAERYGLSQVPIAGLSPDEEPSASQVKEIVDFARENKVTVIFFESLVNPDLSDTIAREVGAQTEVLNPIEGLTGEQASAGGNYFSLMQENLSHLKTALSCN